MVVRTRSVDAPTAEATGAGWGASNTPNCWDRSLRLNAATRELAMAPESCSARTSVSALPTTIRVFVSGIGLSSTCFARNAWGEPPIRSCVITGRYTASDANTAWATGPNCRGWIREPVSMTIVHDSTRCGASLLYAMPPTRPRSIAARINGA
jgi:hypothetical protein